ncbi:SH3 domain-containing protein [Bacillaceae bacterium SIJ1]|uniref:N-acetylmuramoyl-L-alanine amidase n=1 Tax=Litoribacterium kuwaitense TaxID=1398745 RepID=UPI0013EC518A|nr:N-acetylmuramoyl-L-alanine amidase [Litoribacterium kuwaitense]NGP44951.1 SH3 domain-containing protein [Litoribacterium kuwaitense]
MGKSRRILHGFGALLFGLVFLLAANQAMAAAKGTVTVDGLNVRSSPAMDGSVLGKLNTEQEVSVSDTQGDWLTITYKGEKAYVHKDYVSLGKSNGKATEKFAITVNGQTVQSPVSPVMENDRLLVPFRAISEALGVTVHWVNDTRQVHAKDNGKKIVMTVDSADVSVDGQTTTVNPAPSIRNEHTMIPLRFFSETFGATVHWDQNTQSVTIKRDASDIPPAPNPSDGSQAAQVEQVGKDTELKATPMSTSKTIASLNKGDDVRVIREEGGWLYVEHEGKKGYISQTVLSSGGTEAEGLVAVVNADILNVRSSADASSKKLGSLDRGEEVDVITTQDNWAKIRRGNLVGWIHTGYATLYDRGGQLTRELSAPEKTEGNNRTTFTWSKLGDVNTRQIMTEQGVAISTNAGEIGSFNFQHPGIQSVSTTNGNYGKQIDVKLSPGYHYVVRHSSGSVSLDILPSGLKGKKVVVDAGHGGHDSGAVGATGLLEKEVTLDVAKKLKAKLEAAGATVIESRPTGDFTTLSGRVQIAHENGGDVFVSIHADSFSATSKGSTSFYHSGKNPSWEQSKELSDLVIHYLTSNLGTVSRGSVDKSFHVIRETEIPAILAETAFLSNPQEEALLKTDAFREKAATALFQALEAYFK